MSGTKGMLHFTQEVKQEAVRLFLEEGEAHYIFLVGYPCRLHDFIQNLLLSYFICLHIAQMGELYQFLLTMLTHHALYLQKL
jgi:hypothetical protein